jgi:pyruvate kinase
VTEAGLLAGSAGRRTAVVATLGPSCESWSSVEGLILAGMDVVRLSMGNGTRQWHRQTVELVRTVAARLGRPVRFLADLQGRKNRLGHLPGGRSEWAEGDAVVLTTRRERPGSHRTWLELQRPPREICPGTTVFIDDGALVLTVTEVDPDRLHCVTVQGGVVTAGRGVTIPGPADCSRGLTERDADDLRFALSLGVDLVALSFVRTAADYDCVRAIARDQLIIGKIEHPDAMTSLSSIADAFDGLMVARGDLALEVAFEEVPFVQKAAVAECARLGKVSMVATQLLHSMRSSRRPTRAEVADVATAVLEGADALVLTGETGYGRDPVRVVEVLCRVIERAERFRSTAGPTNSRPGGLHAELHP